MLDVVLEHRDVLLDFGPRDVDHQSSSVIGQENLILTGKEKGERLPA